MGSSGADANAEHDAEQFDLVDKKELAPLDELNDAILAEGKGR